MSIQSELYQPASKCCSSAPSIDLGKSVAETASMNANPRPLYQTDIVDYINRVVEDGIPLTDLSSIQSSDYRSDSSYYETEIAELEDLIQTTRHQTDSVLTKFIKCVVHSIKPTRIAPILSKVLDNVHPHLAHRVIDSVIDSIPTEMHLEILSSVPKSIHDITPIESDEVTNVVRKIVENIDVVELTSIVPAVVSDAPDTFVKTFVSVVLDVVPTTVLPDVVDIIVGSAPPDLLDTIIPVIQDAAVPL